MRRDELATAFRAAGVRPGGVLLVHSALRRLGPVDGGAEAVIEALLDVLGPDGTLAMPTHTWKVVNAAQPVFHQALTPSNVGALTNVFRLRPGVQRSLHPTHSLAACGARATELLAGHERDRTPCAAGGPYDRLLQWGGSVLIIGADLACCTLFHGCEEWAGLPWAVTRDSWRLHSIAGDGRVIDIDLHHHHVNTWDQYPRLEPGLVAAGALWLSQIGDCPLRLLDAVAACDWLIGQLRRDPALILPPGGLPCT